MAGMEAYARVAAIEKWPLSFGPWCAVGRDVGLQPAKQGRRRGWLDGCMMDISRIRVDLGRGQLKLAYVAAQIRQEPVVHQLLGGVVGASRWLAGTQTVAQRGRLHAIPQLGGGGGQQQVHTSRLSERGEYAEVIRIQSGGAEY